MGAAGSKVKEAGSSAEAGSMSCFISWHFILSETELDRNINPSCYKTVLIRTQWLSKTKIQLMATEARTDKNDLSSPALSLLWASIWVIQTQWYSSSYCKGTSSCPWRRWVPWLSAHSTVPTGYTDLSLSPSLPKPSSLHHTHRNRGVYLNPENRGLNFFTPLNNVRPFQKCRHELRLTVHRKEIQWMQGYQTGDTSAKDPPMIATSLPAPEKQRWTWTSGHPLCQPCGSGPEAAAPRAASLSHWSRWRTHSSPATV